MKTAGNTVLITGGATGIGLALAKAFREHGNEVIICGRREDRLQEAQAALPGLHTRVCDISVREERAALCQWVRDSFGGVNILINNAGIQRMPDFKQGPDAFAAAASEIETNLTAPVHLASLFVPLLMEQPAAAIVNIASGLTFKPLPHVPVYGATKAAIHAFSIALRMQLKDTSVRVFGIVPPLVDTELDKGSREKRQLKLPAIAPAAVAAAILDAVAKDEYEIVIGTAASSVQYAREYLEQMLEHHVAVD